MSITSDFIYPLFPRPKPPFYSDSISPDLPTLLGVSTGIFVLAGLICMVLHLFSKTKYPRARGFADAHHAGPPVFFASDTGNLLHVW